MKARERWIDLAVVAALFLFVFVLYGDARIGIPRADHLFFLKEHDRLPAAWDFFWNAVSYNRVNSRVTLLGTGDHFLYRPLFGALIAAPELLSGGRITAVGTAAVLFHWIACSALYFVGRSWVGPGLGALAALLMAADLAGMDAVVWTHIVPYVLAVALVGVAAWLVSREQTWAAAAALLAGSWIHESALAALCVLALVTTLTRRSSGPFWGALAAYAVADLADLWVHPWSAVAHSSFTEPQAQYFPVTATLDGLRTVGLQVLGRVVPGAVDLRFQDAPWDRALWPVASVPDGVTLPLGALAGLAVVGAFVVCARRGGGVVAAMLLATWLALVGSLVVLRFSVRSIQYLGISTYYFYLLDYLVLLLALWTASFVPRISSRLGTGLVALGALVAVVPASLRIHALLSERAPFLDSVLHLHGHLDAFFEAHPDLCYGGPLGTTLAGLHPAHTPLVLERDHACSGDGRRPAWLTTRGPEVGLVASSAAPTAGVRLPAVEGASWQTPAPGTVIHYTRGTWLLQHRGTDVASAWHVPADGEVTVAVLAIEGQGYALVDDRVLGSVPLEGQIEEAAVAWVLAIPPP